MGNPSPTSKDESGLFSGGYRPVLKERIIEAYMVVDQFLKGSAIGKECMPMNCVVEFPLVQKVPILNNNMLLSFFEKG